jgi:hypothetical protein
MYMMRVTFRLMIVLALVPVAAQAYIDPGSGMLLVQGLFALVGGIIVFVKNPIKTVKSLFARIFKSKQP